MKATGIVRRIDDLGRVVVPKEIRRTLRIREGDPLEIYTDREGEIILKKYSPIGELSQFAKQCADAISQNTGHTAIITDRDQVIAVSGTAKKELLNKPITKELEKIINGRKIVKGDSDFIPLTSVEAESISQVIHPIICEGDVIGSVVVQPKDNKAQLTETESKLAAVTAAFLGKQMES